MILRGKREARDVSDLRTFRVGQVVRTIRGQIVTIIDIHSRRTDAERRANKPFKTDYTVETPRGERMVVQARHLTDKVNVLDAIAEAADT